MNRKEFFKKALYIGASGGLLAGAPVFSQTKDEHWEQEQKFKEEWVRAFIENLEELLDKSDRIQLMESCGRDCARRGAIRLAESCKGNPEKMIGILTSVPDIDIRRNTDGSLQVIYKKCLCELVGKGPDRLPDTYCECSRGWLLEMFGTASGKPVDVSILKTIKRGEDACEFLVAFL